MSKRRNNDDEYAYIFLNIFVLKITAYYWYYENKLFILVLFEIASAVSIL